jgi:hypothetical protein
LSQSFVEKGAVQGLRVKPLVRAVIEQKCALIAQFTFIRYRSPAEIIKVHSQQLAGNPVGPQTHYPPRGDIHEQTIHYQINSCLRTHCLG